jgi:hypothetical protein
MLIILIFYRDENYIPGGGSKRDVFPIGPSQDSWPFIGKDPQRPILGGAPFLQACQK